jgi:hypothetical protein
LELVNETESNSDVLIGEVDRWDFHVDLPPQLNLCFKFRPACIRDGLFEIKINDWIRSLILGPLGVVFVLFGIGGIASSAHFHLVDVPPALVAFGFTMFGLAVWFRLSMRAIRFDIVEGIATWRVRSGVFSRSLSRPLQEFAIHRCIIRQENRSLVKQDVRRYGVCIVEQERCMVIAASEERDGIERYLENLPQPLHGLICADWKAVMVLEVGLQFFGKRFPMDDSSS